MEGIDQREFILKFKQEAEEHIRGLNQGLLKLESDPNNKEIVNELFRLAHTIKGAARMVGLTKIGELAHKVEDVFGKVREEGRQLNRDEIDLMFSSFDAFKELLDEVAGEEEVDITEFCVLLSEVVEGERKEGKEELPKPDSAQKPKAKAPPARSLSDDSKNRPVGRRLEDKEETIRVRTVKLDKLSDLVNEMIMNQRQIEQDMWELKEIYLQTKEGLRLVSSIRETIQSTQAVLEGKKEQLLADTDRIQDINVYLRNSILKLFKRSLDDFSHLTVKTKEMQQEVLEARMLPLFIIFDDLPRAVRDLAKQFGKEISVRISGGSTELDKKMLEKLRDPVIHLIRNAVDHGIESPEEREKLKKERSGMVEISSWNEGDRIVVEIKDNGRGIDWQKVSKAAVKKGFISPKVENELNENEIADLLFIPGFSTSSIITDVSGRGVGLDVVKRNLEELKGIVSISSSIGQGTTVRMEMPLTLAMQRVLLVKVGTETLAFPTTSVQEIINIDWKDVRTIEGKQALMVRKRTIPLACLSTVLGWDNASSEKSGEGLCVVVQWEKKTIGFLVDKVVGEKEVVIKSLGKHFEKLKNVAGSTILGSGDVVVILHVADLIDSARGHFSKLSLLKKQKKISGDHRYILLVEDSFTTREMEKSILEASGYSVDTAVDGVEAVEKAGRKRYDLFVVDIQMPRMDGFQFTEYLRGDKYYKDAPIIIVTSKEKEEDRIRGVEAGANAYITKRYFDQNILLDTINRLIGQGDNLREEVGVGKDDKSFGG